jgi:thiol-disulfide isomerase/thioredoxin
MMYLMLSLFLKVGSGYPANPASVQPSVGDSLTIKVMNYDQFNDTTYLVNFWATWCAPCVKELPYFSEVQAIHHEGPFKMILVSLDFKKDYLSRLQPFVQEHQLEPYVVVLEDNRADYWINDIAPQWSGAIPATLVYKGDQREFYERTFQHADELSAILKPFLN